MITLNDHSPYIISSIVSTLIVVDVLNKTDELKDMLNGVSLNQPFSGQLSMVAKLMILNEERNVNRDVFLVHSGGHDGHSLGKNIMNDLLPGINAGIEGFYNELHSRDMLRNVTFVLMSEFGRSITPNSGRGSDHAVSSDRTMFVN